MRRNTSLPHLLNKSVVNSNKVGTVLARHSPLEPAMVLHLNAQEEILKIQLKQLINGNVHTFTLAQIDYESLFIGWMWSAPCMFIIAQSINSKLYDEIFCTPTDENRNMWLKFFENKNVTCRPVKLSADNVHIAQQYFRLSPIKEVGSVSSGDFENFFDSDVHSKKPRRKSMQ